MAGKFAFLSPIAWSPCCPRTIQLPLAASPRGRLSRPQSTISQSDFHQVIRTSLLCRLGVSLQVDLEPDGSPLFTCNPLLAYRRYEPRKHLSPLAIGAPRFCLPLFDRESTTSITFISGLFCRSLDSGLQPPCLRFVVSVTVHHARLGTRLLARLCRGRHLRRLDFRCLQGANQKRSGPTCGCDTKSALYHQPSQERMTIMASHSSASPRVETPHVNRTTRTATIIDALKRRALAVLNDESIDAPDS